ncbi:aminotransferase class IV, partial [Salmonella enterica subsp. enterica serovar Montevideo]|nr:aminotransferase class IV [Salmonella enterica subsp. enterica serovar Montevideo]
GENLFEVKDGVLFTPPFTSSALPGITRDAIIKLAKELGIEVRLTIGNFDGVHRGHRALLQGLQEEGRRRGLPVVVMIFEPQPLE